LQEEALVRAVHQAVAEVLADIAPVSVVLVAEVLLVLHCHYLQTQITQQQLVLVVQQLVVLAVLIACSHL
jgi:hypothetical protein